MKTKGRISKKDKKFIHNEGRRMMRHVAREVSQFPTNIIDESAFQNCDIKYPSKKRNEICKNGIRKEYGIIINRFNQLRDNLIEEVIKEKGNLKNQTKEEKDKLSQAIKKANLQAIKETGFNLSGIN